MSDGRGPEEDGDEDHDHADGEHGDVQAGDDVPVPDTANVQGRGAQVPEMELIKQHLCDPSSHQK